MENHSENSAREVYRGLVDIVNYHVFQNEEISEEIRSPDLIFILCELEIVQDFARQRSGYTATLVDWNTQWVCPFPPLKDFTNFSQKNHIPVREYSDEKTERATGTELWINILVQTKKRYPASIVQTLFRAANERIIRIAKSSL